MISLERDVQQLEILKLAPYEASVLRERAMDILFPLSTEDKKLIANMIYSIQPEQLKKANAPWDGAVGMAANQWGFNKRIFLYCPTGDTKNALEVIINPSYEAISSETETTWEGCFSVPLATGNILRPTKIKVKYQNMDGDVIEKTLDGWEARVWQHENDHLNGLLYDDKHAGKCLEKKEFASKKAVQEFRSEEKEG